MPDCVLSSAIFFYFSRLFSAGTDCGTGAKKGRKKIGSKKKDAKKNGSKKKDAKKTGGHKIRPRAIL